MTAKGKQWAKKHRDNMELLAGAKDLPFLNDSAAQTWTWALFQLVKEKSLSIDNQKLTKNKNEAIGRAFIHTINEFFGINFS